MNFLQRNLFTKLRADNFGIKEEMEPMTTFKKKKIAQMLKNVNDVPAGEVKMNNGFLNRRLSKIQEDPRHRYLYRDYLSAAHHRGKHKWNAG